MAEIQTIAVIGSGTMGGGIAISALAGQIDTIVIDSSKTALERARSRVRKFFERQVEKGRMTPEQATGAVGRLQVSTELADAAGSDLVIEAVFEDLNVKKSVFSALEQIVSANCHLATNTSALRVSEIAAGLARPDRFCGLHFFSPAEINPAVEVVRGDATGDSTIATARMFLERCKKIPIECRDQSGFALNRFFCPYTNEAARCLDEGLGSPAQIDTVARDTFGVPLGPFSVMNIVKPRINLAAVRNLAHLGPFYTPSPGLVTCGEPDDDWPLEDNCPPLDQRAQTAIAERLMGAVFFAVQEELGEGVVDPEVLDLGATKAFAFRTGPVEMMQAMSPQKVGRVIGLVSP